MQKWEYMVFSVNDENRIIQVNGWNSDQQERLHNFLDRLGAEGWEFCGFLVNEKLVGRPARFLSTSGILKRPLIEKVD